MPDMRRFDGRSIFVTGGGHGIGRGIALQLAEEGGMVAVCDVDLDAATAVAAEITHSGAIAMAIQSDVTVSESVDWAVAQTVERFGALNVMVNTAGGDFDEPEFESIEDDLWQRKIDLNLTGTVRCIRAGLRHLISAGSGSNVVSIGSVNGSAAFGGYPYSAAKAGLENLTKNLAAKYGRRGVRFNLVTPATIRTRNWDGRDADLQRLAKMYPLGRIGEPSDIAKAVAFLASDDAAWITGINLPVDGGIMTGPNAFLENDEE